MIWQEDSVCYMLCLQMWSARYTSASISVVPSCRSVGKQVSVPVYAEAYIGSSLGRQYAVLSIVTCLLRCTVSRYIAIFRFS